MVGSISPLRIVVSVVSVIVLTASGDSVHARAELCNGGNTLLYLAEVASLDGALWSATGWTRLPAGVCRRRPDDGRGPVAVGQPVYYAFGQETPAGAFAIPVGAGIGVSSVQRSGGVSVASVTSTDRRFCVDPRGDFRRTGSLDALASCDGRAGWVPVAFSHAVATSGTGGHVRITVSPHQSGAGSSIETPDGGTVPPPR